MFSRKIKVFTESVADQIKQLEKRIAKMEKIVRNKSREARTVHVKTYWDEDLIG